MRGLRDTLVGWIDERMKNMLATPRAWGSDEAIEIQVLRLLEFRALVLLPELEAEAPGRLVDGYMAYLAKTYPAKPNRPLSQIVESDYLGQNLAAELRRAVDFFTQTMLDDISRQQRRVITDGSSNFVGDDEFNAACNGQIDALRMLTKRYRFSTFVLLIKGEEVACQNLHVEQHVIRYRFPGQYINHVEQVETREVERLIRVVK